MRIDEDPAFVDHMSFGSRAVDDFDPHPWPLEPWDVEPDVLVRRIGDQQLGVAMKQMPALIGLVGGGAGDEHSKHAEVGVPPVVLVIS